MLSVMQTNTIDLLSFCKMYGILKFIKAQREATVDRKINEWMEEFTPRIRGLLFALTQDAKLAEDLCQETFIKATKKLREDLYRDPIRHPKAILFTIAKNLSIDHARYWRYRGGYPSWIDDLSESTPGLQIEDPFTSRDERIEYLSLAIEKLSCDQRSLLHQHWTEGLTKTEIARRGGTSVQAVINRLERTYQKLRKEIEELKNSENRNRAIAQYKKAIEK